jgi:hypothetical protein
LARGEGGAYYALVCLQMQTKWSISAT